MGTMDSNYVQVDYVQPVEPANNAQVNQNQNQNQNQYGGFVVMENTFFRDIVCFIIASIACCPVCPFFAWLSLLANQQATEAYWRGDYHGSATKQSCAIKLCIAQVLIGVIFLIIIFVENGSE